MFKISYFTMYFKKGKLLFGNFYVYLIAFFKMMILYFA